MDNICPLIFPTLANNSALWSFTYPCCGGYSPWRQGWEQVLPLDNTETTGIGCGFILECSAVQSKHDSTPPMDTTGINGDSNDVSRDVVSMSLSTDNMLGHTSLRRCWHVMGREPQNTTIPGLELDIGDHGLPDQPRL